MPSGKQSKRRRQAARAPMPPTRTRRQASPRVLMAAAAVVILIVVGIVLAVFLVDRSSNVSSSSANAAKLPDAADVQHLLAGIPQHGNVLGQASAPVTMIEYVDLQCPFCQQFETAAMPALISRYVRKGKVKVEARVIAFLGLDSQRGRLAALAAGAQDKQFNFMQLLYDNQGAENTGWLDDDMVKSAAASIPGLDADRLLSEKDSGAISDKVNALDEQQAADNVKSTPTIFVGKSGAKPKLVTLTSPTDETAVAAAIDAAL